MIADQEVKSIGHEETFPVDLHDHAALDHRLVGLADGVASRLRAAAVTARTVQLKVRFGDFTTVTRSRTLAEPTDLAADLRRVAGELLHALDVGAGRPPARGLRPAAGAAHRPTTADQGTLFGEPGDRPTPATSRPEAGAVDGPRRPSGRARAIGRRGAGPVRSWCRGARRGA